MARLPRLLSLSMLNYSFSAGAVNAELVENLLWSIGGPNGSNGGGANRTTVQAALVEAGCATPAGVRGLMWLWKFGLVDIAAVS